jgi:hypothetical protein
LEQDGWELASGVALNEEHPDTFWIPTAKARASIGPTDFVKLSFQVIQSDDVAGQVVVGERMWVKEGTHGPYFWGTLANDPHSTAVRSGLCLASRSCFFPNTSWPS